MPGYLTIHFTRVSRSRMVTWPRFVRAARSDIWAGWGGQRVLGRGPRDWIGNGSDRPEQIESCCVGAPWERTLLHAWTVLPWMHPGQAGLPGVHASGLAQPFSTPL